jgi:hypothetical protein
MDPREAFKIGFMARCIEEGLSQEKTAELIEKAALDGAISGGVDALKAVLYPAAALALAAPPTIGGLAAYFNNRALDTADEGDVEEIKQRELKESYRRMAEQLRQTKALQDRKAKRKRSGQVFL